MNKAKHILYTLSHIWVAIVALIPAYTAWYYWDSKEHGHEFLVAMSILVVVVEMVVVAVFAVLFIMEYDKEMKREQNKKPSSCL